MKSFSKIKDINPDVLIVSEEEDYSTNIVIKCNTCKLNLQLKEIVI